MQRRMTSAHRETLAATALDQLFREARSHNVWRDQPVSLELLRQVYDLMRFGPTSANSSPLRLLFLTSIEAKERLRPALMEGNVEKVMTAPVCAVLGYDLRFYEFMPMLFPHNPEAQSWFDGDATEAEINAFRNSTLQGAYLIIAARALGLDCGPMSGFDNDMVDAEFFPDGRVRSNFLCCIGYGDTKALFPRSPRFDFDDVCTIL